MSQTTVWCISPVGDRSLRMPFPALRSPSPAREEDLAGRGGQFADAFARYTPPQSVTPEHANNINDLRTDQSVTTQSCVRDKNREKIQQFQWLLRCYG